MGPLEGIKVVEFAGIGPGPFCCMIKANPDRVLKDYAETTGDKTESALLHEILQDPSFSFELAPRGSIGIADFMARAGLIKRTPQSWKDYFFPALYDLRGS
jgi:NitT/TauT family transport system substrate-binding protein